MPLQEEYKRKKVTLDFGAADAAKSQDIFIQGELMDMHLRLSKSAGASCTTGTLTMKDEDAYEIYNSTAKAMDANHNLDENRFLSGLNTLTVTLDAAPGTTKTAQAIVTLIYKGHEMGFAH